MGAAGLESLENAYWLWIIKYMTGVFFFFRAQEGKKKQKVPESIYWGDCVFTNYPTTKQALSQNILCSRFIKSQTIPVSAKSKWKCFFYSACRQEIHEGKWGKGFLLIGINFGLGTASCRAIETQLRQNCQHKRMWNKTPAILWLGEERGSGGPVFSVGILITACRTDAINLRLTG